MADNKNIVILGGSYGGVSTAHYLLKHAVPQLPDGDSYQVVLVSASTQVICRPACPRALISDDMFPQDKLFVDIPPLFEQYPAGRFRFVHGSAVKLDHADRTVSVQLADGQKETTATIAFHALVVATGASTSSPLMGLNGDENSLRAAWSAFRQALPTAKSIVIAGGGPTGIETAGELGEYLNGHAGWLRCKLDNPKVAITVVTSGAQVLPVLRTSIASTAEDYLARVGVKVIKNTKVATVTPPEAGTTQATLTTKTSLTLSDGRTLEADIYIPAMGAKPNTGFIDGSLLAADGRVQTNASTLRVEAAGPRIYAIGDAATFARPSVHSIINAIPVLGANIKRDLLLAAGATAGEDRVFTEDVRETQLVPIGRSKGVGAVMGYRVPSLLVWGIKGRDYWLWTTGGLWSGKQWAKES
ncbi:hypothetical protein ASPZODRAFT_148970 [Penicilliopsis zonata CBS 506.65]|uniref:FAD/NAD(P)-binding domain-containing protein n=1 Tax=Penicilliopsis zonata CBS 506.65 TaxID=1073090 RepID=A0A1L9SX55_9EURO|nr:hypothetical protein ASPZODRAFT_148970 [Penicilliopsis zonata CBS 506.65]OJJ51746.1 hypothetical protein ASPZODRAFT_148970 [Penicilliopsis zonata CBS 506.65]